MNTVEPLASPPEAPAEIGSLADRAIPLSFVELNTRLSAIPEINEATPAAHRTPRISILVSLLTLLIAFVVHRLRLTDATQAAIIAATSVMTVAGLVATIWVLRRHFMSQFHPLEDLAIQLDHDLPFHQRIRDWLLAQDTVVLEKFASLSKHRKERVTQKLPLLAGSIPSLGILPVVVAVYLQVRQLTEGREVTWVDLFFFALLVFIYFFVWSISLAKSRLEAMDLYLQEALEESRKRA